MYKLNIVDKISMLLVIIGSLNWGLIGLFNFNLVKFLSDLAPSADISNALQSIIYILVGVAGVNLLFLVYKTKFSAK